MESIGNGAGKLLLFGEHAAVHGYPALGMALPWETRVILSPGEGEEWTLPDLIAEEHANLKGLLSFFFETFPVLRRIHAMELKIESDIPDGMGFGSSAALCVAFVKAVAVVLAGKFLPGIFVKEIGRSIDLMWALANKAERLFHGKPSGIDTGLSLIGNVQAFNFSGKELPESREIKVYPLHLVVGGVPRSGNTRSLVGTINERFLSGDAAVRRVMAELGDIAHTATAGLGRKKKNMAALLGSLADEAHGRLAGMGLSSPALDTVLEEGRAQGALGGKLSGAGGGGAFYLVVQSKEQGKQVAAAVQKVLDALFPGQSLPVAVLEKTRRGVSLC